MANQQHGQESSIVERRLRPIYDSLEMGNPKKALQEAEKVLKKTPKLQCALALKSLSFLRLGKEDESQNILSTLEDSDQYDEATLQVMTFVYKETEQFERICTLYAKASETNPTNEDILSHLFMAYVRTNNFKMQQQVAMKLYKLKTAKNPYYFWAVMSVVLQALRGPDSTNIAKSRLLLALAERMVYKFIVEDKLDAEQEVQLYLNILQYQEKYQEALNFLEGPICTKLYPGAPVTLNVMYLKQMKEWAKVNKLLKSLLLNNLDRWDYYTDYIVSCLELQNMKDDTEDSDFNLEMCHSFLCKLIDMGQNVRGPYLARLDLFRLMKENSLETNKLLGEFEELLVDYFRKFGHKPCCSNDIKKYLTYLEPGKRAAFASRLLQECQTSSVSLPKNKEQMQKHICSLQISRICNAHESLSDEHMNALYTALALHYEHGRSAFGQNSLPTDIGSSDNYALIAVYIMYDLAYKTKSSEYLIEALYLLQYVLSNGPSNFHAKLLILQIYQILGCGLGANNVYEKLDIKHIQLDSMGYLHCGLLPASGIYSISKPLYDTTLKFFTTSYKDTIDYLAMSYKFGSFSKLQEFMDFREKLSNSFHYTYISVEALLLELVCSSGDLRSTITSFKHMNINPDEDRIIWDDLSDNRDLSVIVNWNPKEKYNSDEDQSKSNENTKAKDSFVEDIELLRVRSNLLRLVAACVDMFHSDEDEIKKLETLKKLTQNWKELFDRIKEQTCGPVVTEYLVDPIPSRLYSVLQMNYFRVFNDLAVFIEILGSSEFIADACSDVRENIKVTSKIFCDAIYDFNQTTDQIWNRKNSQDVIVQSVEILSLLTFVLSTTADGLSTIINQKQQKKNKNKINSTEKDKLSSLLEILQLLKTELIKCDNLLDSWAEPLLSSHLSESKNVLSISVQIQDEVNATFKDNHKTVVKELKCILKDKIKLIK